MIYELPTVLKIGGVDYKIRGDGDYRIVLDTFSILEDTNLTKQERLLAATGLFYEDFNSFDDVINFPYLDEAVEQMFNFFTAGKPDDGISKHRKVIDWEKDFSMICAAINTISNKEIRELPYLHWWTFNSYYMSVGESILSTVVGIRSKILEGKKLEKWERDYRRDNPEYFKWNSKTAEDIDTENMIMAIWNSEE